MWEGNISGVETKQSREGLVINKKARNRGGITPIIAKIHLQFHSVSSIHRSNQEMFYF